MVDPYILSQLVNLVYHNDPLGFNLMLHKLIDINQVVELCSKLVDHLCPEIFDLDQLGPWDLLSMRISNRKVLKDHDTALIQKT